MKRTKPQTLNPYLDEREQQLHDDYEWGLHDSGVRQKYSGKVVAVHKRKVWGTGKNHAAAWAAALRKRDCPPQDQMAFVVVPHRPVSTRKEE